MKKIINEIEVFQLNEDFESTIVEFGPNKSKVIIIDNFYKNPDLVRDLALAIPPTYKSEILNGLPGGRIDAVYKFNHLAPLFYNLMIDVFIPEERHNIPPTNMNIIFNNATFCVNVINDLDLFPCPPHVDSIDSKRYAASVFLNTPDECAGGTAFYTYKGKQEGPDYNDIFVDHYVSDTEDDWELIYLAEMKYNRMIMYQQSILHSAYLKSGMFKDYYRLNQMFFI